MIWYPVGSCHWQRIMYNLETSCATQNIKEGLKFDLSGMHRLFDEAVEFTWAILLVIVAVSSYCHSVLAIHC
jgi:hypothetical protein